MDEENSQVTEQPEIKAEPKKNSSLATEILVWGILGLAFAVTSNVILGLIFSLISLKKVREYKAGGFVRCKQADIGNGLATAGRIVSIVGLIITGVIIAIWLTIAIIALIAGGITLGVFAGSHEITKGVLTVISMF